MTSQEKLEYLQKQCDAIWQEGKEMPTDCPYCYATVQPGEGPCCLLMDKAIRAIIERAQAVDEGMKTYERREFGRMVMGGKYVN